MSTPNDFVPLAPHAFHHENAPPLVIQTAHSNSNFTTTTNTNGTHFNGGGFFSNSIGYDVAMLPFLHHTSQRPAHFNASFAHKQVPVENSTKDDLIQIPTPDGRSNVFNPEPSNNASIQSAYWSRQSQMSPFGVLPHEISPEHIEPEAKYDLNTHFAPAPVINSLNHLPTDCIDRDKKIQVIVSGKSKEPNIKKPYIPKPSEVKLQNINYNEDMDFRNGVINHGTHVNMKVDHKILNYKNPKPETEQLQMNEPVNTVPRDYRVFKPSLFPNSSVPVVKFTGKSKPYSQKQIINDKPQITNSMLKTRLNSNGSPLIQKLEFQEDGQSSPISLTSEDINAHQYSSHPEMVQVIKESGVEPNFHHLNHLNNNVPHTNASAPAYREQLPDMNCQDKKVTQPFTKLPYPSNTQNNSTELQLNRNKTSFAPLYIMYNNPPVSTTPQKRLEKLPERHEIPVAKLNNNPQEVQIKPPLQNGLVGYSSVIMRTDRNYDEDKDKSSRCMGWSDRQIPQKPDKLVYNKTEQVQSSIPEHHHLLLGLTERQHSYFDTTPCPSQVNSHFNNIKCSPKSLAKNIYEETQRIQEPQPVQNQDNQMHHYQQYIPMNNKPQVPITQPIEPPPEIDKSYRKRKLSKSNIQDTRMNIPEYPRDPPPAHLNLYQQPIQNSGYMMDSSRYDHTKMYNNNEQFYQPNVNNYNMNVPHDNTQHQTVISHNSASRVSPIQRNIPSNPPSLPLSAYFSSFQSNSQYQEFPVNETQNYVSNEIPPVPENKMEKQVYEGRIKVIVPNVEEEFKFLFDSSLPNFKQIAFTPEEEELLKKPALKSMFYRKNIDFLASYIKFLENNCESTETLTDSNSSSIKTWNRNKVVYQPINRGKPDEMETAVPKEPPKAVNKEPETNFENDPRYYPLPKSSDKRRLDSSSDESSDEFSKSKVVKKSEEKKKLSKKDRKESKIGKKFRKENKPKLKKEATPEVKSVKTKLEKLEKAKLKIAKLQIKAEKKKHKADKIKPKMEKALAEIKAIKQSGLQKPKAKEQIKEQKSIPRRKVSDRKAKDGFMLKQKIQGAIDSDDEFHSDSDSDPSWTPGAEEEEVTTKRKSTRIRSVRFKSKLNRKSDIGSFKKNFTSGNKKDEWNPSTSKKESTKNSKTSEISLKFYISKKEANTKHPNVWHLLNGVKLQKFEHFESEGRHLYRGMPEFCKFPENDKNKYQEIEVTLVEDKNDKLIIELNEDTDIPTDGKIKENFMKESLCYEHQFAVYIQTLVSQALDSNFLSEIVKENDLYFLNSMKVIDEVTATYLSDLTGMAKWGENSVNTLVKTWPFISIKNIRNDASKNVTNCASCNETNARQIAIFYGQPYQRETLQGKSILNVPDDIDKTINLCKGCSREVKLFNRIWHQKYHVFVECAKYVSRKKSDNKSKATTDILNELLADTNWLSKLFYDIRNTWLQIWTIVQKAKQR